VTDQRFDIHRRADDSAALEAADYRAFLSIHTANLLYFWHYISKTSASFLASEN
jgi:hypothetical protein